MDRKSIIILAACFGVIVLWPVMLHKVYPPAPVPVSTNVVVTATNGAARTFTNAVAQVPAVSNPVATSPSSPESRFVVHTNIPEQTLTLTSPDARYIFTSRGGGLKEVQLLHFPEVVSSHRNQSAATNDLAVLNAATVPPVLSILGDDSLQGDGVFTLSPIANGVRAEKTLSNGLTIIKDFQINSNFLVGASVRLENQSAQPLNLPSQQWMVGASTPMGPQDNGMAEAVFWYNGSKSASIALTYFNTNTSSFFGLMSRVPQTEFRAGSNNVVWTSAQNQFFALITIPQKPAEAVVVHMVGLPSPSAAEVKANPATILSPFGMQTALIYPGQTLAPAQSVTNQFTIYAGPKEYQTLARLAAHYNNDADEIMSFGWFGPVSKALLVTMNWLHMSLGLAYGWVIILITVVIKMIFWPLTAASTRSAKRMQALQPQLKALQEKYKDDQQKFAAKQWEFYKKNKVNPLSGCLPALLQVPVFIGFYGMLRGAIELRGAPFWWITDLSKPDTVFSIPIPLHFLGWSDGFLPVNPMPLIMGATLLWQASMTPPSPSMDATQQKMMKYMPLMMLVFMYNLSSGLALYWTVSNLLTVLQTKVTKMQPTDPAAGESAKAPVVVVPQKKKNN